MSESILDATLVKDGKRVVATIDQTGKIIESNGVLDANCIVQTENGPQKCVKTYPVLGGGSSSDGILYEENFDTSTNTLSVTTLGENAVNSLTTITGYNANAPLQRLVNLSGAQKWQTRSVNYSSFDGDGRNLTTPTSLSSSISSIDFILQFTGPSAYSTAVQDFLMFVNADGQSLFWNTTGYLGFWDGTQNVNLSLAQSTVSGQKTWFRVTGENTYTLYYLLDNNYTPETLPAISSWNSLGTIGVSFASAKLGFGCAGEHYLRTASDTLYNFLVYANGSKVFDMRADDFVTSSSAIVKNESWS